MRVAVVGGCGHAGLPLAVFLAHKGHQVTAVDSDNDRLAKVRSGEPPFFEPGLNDMLRSVLAGSAFDATNDYSAVVEAEVVVIVVGTDLNDRDQPQNDSVLAVARQLRNHVSQQTSIVLRSTVMPGTTAAVAKVFGDTVFEVAFCPERIAEGRALEELGSMPQLVGTSQETVSNKLRELFLSMGVETITMSWAEAEMSKLILNSWRYAQFAFANEVARLCESTNVSFAKIRSAILDRYPRGQGLMAPGFAGGPCLRKDTLQLIAGTHADSSLFREVIKSHEDAVSRVESTVLDHLGPGRGVVVQLGLAFKPGSDDIRGSVALDLARRISKRVERFYVVDPHVRLSHEFNMLTLDEAFEIADVVVVGTRHPEFVGKKFNVPLIDLGGSKLVIPSGSAL